MPSNLLLLLALLGGYGFLHFFSYTRIRSQALDGYRLLLESAATGVLFSTLAYLSLVLIDWINPAPRAYWHAFAPGIPYLASVGGGALLAIAAAYPLNGILHLFGFSAKRLRRRAVNQYGNEIQRLLQEALAEEVMVAITLDNRKSYIGLVSFAPTLAPNATYFSILPFLSGYRDSATMELIFTTDYLAPYAAGVDSNEFRVVLAIQNVRMASFFDPSVYTSFVVEQEARRPRANDTPPEQTIQIKPLSPDHEESHT